MNINIKVMLCCVFFSTQSILSVGDFENTRLYDGYSSPQPTQSNSAYANLKRDYANLVQFCEITKKLKEQGGNEKVLNSLNYLIGQSSKAFIEISNHLDHIAVVADAAGLLTNSVS